MGLLGFLAPEEPLHPQLTTVQEVSLGGRETLRKKGEEQSQAVIAWMHYFKDLAGSCPLPKSSRQGVIPPSSRLPEAVGASPPTHIPVGISLPFPVTRLLASGRHESALTHTGTTRKRGADGGRLGGLTVDK